ncbi:MAG: hypothetical protein O2887_01720 [Bacteroidetes bacterium]|nr:hypothetical protein [Bacteroidota bacterium]
MAQLKQFYSIHNDGTYNAINFTLTATSGTCYIHPEDTEIPLNIYGDPDFEKINPNFHSQVTNGTNYVDLMLEDYNSSGFSKSISYNVFGPDKKGKNQWEIILDDEKEYSLNLNYGIGMARVDLSGVPVKNFHVKTGSADVDVDYTSSIGNKIEMDTFYVKVDMGSIIAKKMHLSRAKNIITDIGFGNATLDFSDIPTTRGRVDATVGAGNLEVLIPRKNAPVIIFINDSPLCSVKLAKDFKEVDDNTYVNKDYSSEASNLLTFNIDVALGNVIFKYSN